MQIYKMFIAANEKECSSIFIPNNIMIPTLFPSCALSSVVPLYPLPRPGLPPYSFYK